MLLIVLINIFPILLQIFSHTYVVIGHRKLQSYLLTYLLTLEFAMSDIHLVITLIFAGTVFHANN